MDTIDAWQEGANSQASCFYDYCSLKLHSAKVLGATVRILPVGAPVYSA